MDYLETSGNLLKLATEVSGRFPDFSINKFFYEKTIIIIKNSETSAAGFRRFLEVSG
jgi:hypothetical protein